MRAWETGANPHPAYAGNPLRKGARPCGGRRTREEQRRARWSAVCKLVLVAAGLVLLLILGMDTAPPTGATVAETAASTAAAQEYGTWGRLGWRSTWQVRLLRRCWKGRTEWDAGDRKGRPYGAKDHPGQTPQAGGDRGSGLYQQDGRCVGGGSPVDTVGQGGGRTAEKGPGCGQ